MWQIGSLILATCLSGGFDDCVSRVPTPELCSVNDLPTNLWQRRTEIASFGTKSTRAPCRPAFSLSTSDRALAPSGALWDRSVD
jgi:hypothetical protein